MAAHTNKQHQIAPLFGPLADSRKRLAKLEDQRAGLSEIEQPDEYARIISLIEFEMTFIASFSEFTKERESKRRPAYSVSVKGLLQLLG